MKKLFLIISIISALILVSCSITSNLQPDSGIVLYFKFPEDKASIRAIPSNTNYIEVALKEASATSWTTKTAKGEPGSTVTMTFNVSPGNYTINAIAKKVSSHWYEKQVLAYASVTNIVVEPSKYTTATVTLMPFTWEYPDTPPELIEGSTTTLTATLVCPKDFVPDMSKSAIWLYGELKDNYSLGDISFTLDVASITGEWATVVFTSEEFVVPQVTEATTVSYFFTLYIDTSKWIDYYMNSPTFPVTIKKQGSGINIIIN